VHALRMRRLAAATAVVGVASTGVATTATAAAPRLSGTAAGQVAALQDLKRDLSPAERKLDGRLAVELRRRAGGRIRAAAPRLRTGVKVTAAATTDVDIRARVTARLLARLEKAGAQIRHASRGVGSIRATVPLASLERIAGLAAVRRVDAAVGALTARMPRSVSAESKAAKRARLERALAAAQITPQAVVTSEGDAAHAADDVRTERGVTGAGVKLCGLSDGVDSLAESVAAGELPDVDVLPGQAGEGDEGTAMLEILHDLAPGADLGFATAFTSDASFADNIRTLRSDADCDVIADDVLYYNESPFQDGPIAQSVAAVLGDGALYFSSAGNEGNVLDGTSGNYEDDFAGSGRGVGKFAGEAHDFDPGAAVQVFEPVTPESADSVATLFWAEPLGAAGSDYDLYVFDATGAVVAFSQSVQDGNDDPFEILRIPLGGLRMAVVRFSGAARYLQLSDLRGRFEDAGALRAFTTPGVTRGHSAVEGAFSTAAAPAAGPLPFDLEVGDPPNPAGPFPDPFTRAQLPERFTSDGPRRVFFEADGTPIGTDGEVRRKPDITAADGVRTSVDGFDPFFGTSAAAPHAAAIAGLVLSGNPGATSDEVREAFDATALDLQPAGFDPRSGVGVIRADLVADYTGLTPQPLAEAGDPVVTPAGDGDAFLEPGETATAPIPVTNRGDGAAGGVSVRVTTDDPRATVTPRTRSYGTIDPGATALRDFTLALAQDYPVGRPLRLSVRVTFAGSFSPTTATLVVRTGQPSATPTVFAYTGPPVAIPDASTAGARVTFAVAGLGYAGAIAFSIDGTACSTVAGAETVGLDHTFMGDLVATLTAPGGDTATLFDRSGGSGNNLCQVVFDDAAAREFADAISSQAPFTGSWRPASPLAELIDAPVDGTWTLTVADTAARDTGGIRAVSLRLTGFEQE
jgi:subtilisin-like proprotein convertase family protein